MVDFAVLGDNMKMERGQLTPLPDLARHDTVYLDTETTGLGYDSRPVGLSWKTPDGRKAYARWGHPSENNVDLATVVQWARRELKGRPAVRKVFHNAAYDLRELAYVGVEVGDRVEDTGIMCAVVDEHEPDKTLNGLARKFAGLEKSEDALNEWCAQHFGGRPTRTAQVANYHRAPGGVVSPYAIGDVDCTEAVDRYFRPRVTSEGVEDIFALECAVTPIVLRMHLQGVRVDQDRARWVQAQLAEKLAELREAWDRDTGGVNINSSLQLAPLFARHGIDVWRTPKGGPSVTKEFLEACDHELAGRLRALRQLTHYAGTFVQNYILDNVAPDGCIHGEFHQVRTSRYGTITGRFSSGGGLNLQNLPARDETWAPVLRGLFVPNTPEHRWLKIDYSQIEYRFFAHYAGGRLVDAYRDNPLQDFHDMVSILVFGDASKPNRKRAKNVNFAKLYGAGVRRLALTIGCTVEEAQAFVDQYNARVPEAQALYQKAMNRGASRGYIITWGGRKLRFERGNRGYEKTYAALNKLLQGSAADLMKKAMVRVAAAIDWEESPLHLTVHDELDLSVPRGAAGEAVARRLKEMMEDFALDVPIVAEAELGEDWGHTAKLAA